MKKYFISIDYWIPGFICKNAYCTLDVDLTRQSLPEVAKDVIKELDPDIDIDNEVIHITAFNNIEI